MDLRHFPQSASFRYRLQLSWFAPFKRFIARLQSKHDVNDIIRVWKNKRISGARLSVYRSKDDHLVVGVDGIPLDVADETIRSAFFEHSGDIISVGADLSTTIETVLHDLLEPYGLTHLRIEMSRPKDRLMKGWATFFTYKDAIAAQQALSSRPDALENLSLRAFLGTSITYRIPVAQYLATQSGWQNLCQQDINLNVKIQQDTVTLQIHSSNETHLAVVHPLVNCLLRGEPLHDADNFILFSPMIASFFLSKEGKRFLEDISLSTGAWVCTNNRFGSMRLFGSDDAREMAKEMLLQKCAQLKVTRLTVQLSNSELACILDGDGVTRLRRMLPSADIQVDSTTGQASCCGGQSVLWKLQSCIRMLCVNPPPTSDGVLGTLICPICLDRVRDLVTPPCSHPHCFHCLSTYATVAAESRDLLFPLMCQNHDRDGQKCGEKLPLSLLRSLLSGDQFHALLESALFNYIDMHPGNFGYCPTPSC
ncbi:hypothetical protein CPB86DRAFT_779561 [Serendipita vermifera]|nr:hypothetical protein CPB86DRAFT_779561 [Serendipita vermifera]